MLYAVPQLVAPLWSIAMRLSLASVVLAWVAEYPNDYSGYVANRRVAIEGGYEAANDHVSEMGARRRGKPFWGTVT